MQWLLTKIKGLLDKRLNIMEKKVIQQIQKINLSIKVLISTFDKDIETALENLKYQLEVDEEYQDAFLIARNLLKLAYQTMNEKWQFVHIYAGAGYYYCKQYVINIQALYFGFRSRQAPYLLIDISDKLEKCSVIKLARCYLKLLNFLKMNIYNGESKKLSQNLQFIDPSIYIPRFVRAMDFKEKQCNIIETAKKLVKGMMLDWMSFGRRPASLCGAALLISARFHGENLTTSEVCRTVFVCDETIRKRLAEFNQTKLAQLTVEQFDQIQDIEDVPGGYMDPPAYTRARVKEENQVKEITNNKDAVTSFKVTGEDLNKLTMEKALQIEMLKYKKKEKMSSELKNDLFTISKQPSNKSKISENAIYIESSEFKKPDEKKPFNTENIDEQLSELNEDEMNEFILTTEQSEQKKIIWGSMYGDWLREREKINEKKKTGQIKEKIKKVKPKMINAPDPQTAILEHSKFKKQINKAALDDMFSTTSSKKVKIEPKPVVSADDFINNIQGMLEKHDEIKSKKQIRKAIQ